MKTLAQSRFLASLGMTVCGAFALKVPMSRTKFFFVLSLFRVFAMKNPFEELGVSGIYSRNMSQYQGVNMLYKTSEHIEGLMVCEEAVRRQFEISEIELEDQAIGDSDPLREKEHEVVPGMINKYGNRVLCLLTAECAAYCRFCTRRRLVSDIEQGRIGTSHVEAWVDYLCEHPEVREVIISGGDPFTVNDDLFDRALSELSSPDSIKIVRIGTRAPVSDPSLVNCSKLDAIARVEKPVYVGIHFEHPSEITRSTIRCCKNLISAGAILYSQTVFLKGVNDDYQTLYDLFTGLLENGVRPYYIYRCDPVPGATHFQADPAIERRIMTRLRRDLSGLACPTYVIDAPDGSGKIPVPLEFWDADTTAYTDFEGKEHLTEYSSLRPQIGFSSRKRERAKSRKES